MDKKLHPLEMKVWAEITYPFPNFNRHWGLGMDKWFHSTHYNGCNYLFMLGYKLTHVRKRGTRWINSCIQVSQYGIDDDLPFVKIYEKNIIVPHKSSVHVYVTRWLVISWRFFFLITESSRSGICTECRLVQPIYWYLTFDIQKLAYNRMFGYMCFSQMTGFKPFWITVRPLI